MKLWDKIKSVLSGTFVKDLAERAATTYVESFVGLLLASNVFLNGSINVKAVGAAAVAALPAALSVVKSLVAKHLGDPDSASLVQ